MEQWSDTPPSGTNEELWARGAELVKQAKPQRRGENILPKHSYHPWFYYATEKNLHPRTAPLFQALAHAGLPARGFYAIADALLDKNTSMELTWITWGLISRRISNDTLSALSSKLVGVLNFTSMLSSVFQHFVELTPEDLRVPVPHYEALETCAKSRSITNLAQAIWNAHYMESGSRDKDMELWPLILTRLGDELAERGESLNAGAMEQVGTLLHEQGDLQGILSDAWRGGVGNFLLLHDYIQEYNLDWALAAMDWQSQSAEVTSQRSNLCSTP